MTDAMGERMRLATQVALFSPLDARLFLRLRPAPARTAGDFGIRGARVGRWQIHGDHKQSLNHMGHARGRQMREQSPSPGRRIVLDLRGRPGPSSSVEDLLFQCSSSSSRGTVLVPVLPTVLPNGEIEMRLVTSSLPRSQLAENRVHSPIRPS